MRERLEQLWDNIRDPYWRLDHPEVTVLLLSLISGAVSLVFAYLQKLLLGRSTTNGPDTP